MSKSSLHAVPTYPCDVGSISADYMPDNHVRNCPLTNAVDRKSTDPTPVFPSCADIHKVSKDRRTEVEADADHQSCTLMWTDDLRLTAETDRQSLKTDLPAENCVNVSCVNDLHDDTDTHKSKLGSNTRNNTCIDGDKGSIDVGTVHGDRSSSSKPVTGRCIFCIEQKKKSKKKTQKTCSCSSDQIARLYNTDKLSQLKRRILLKSENSTVDSVSTGRVAGSSSHNIVPSRHDVCTGKQPDPNDLYKNANQTAMISDPVSLCRFVSSRSAVGKRKKKGWIK